MTQPTNKEVRTGCLALVGVAVLTMICCGFGTGALALALDYLKP